MSDDSKVRLAINLADLDRVSLFVRQILLGGKLDLSEAIKTDPDRMDETAVAFSCDTLTAACCIDTIRSHDRRVKDHPTRAYVFRESWTKLPSDAVLSIIVADKPCLNPTIFPRSVGAARQVAPPVRRFVPGQKGGA